MSQSRPDHLTWRHWVVAFLVVASIAGVMFRLYEVQVVNHEHYLQEAAATRQGAITVPAPRGAILDTTGYPLATSVDTWDIYIDRFLWRDRERASIAAIRLGDFLDRDPDELMRLGTEEAQGDVLVLRDIDYRRGAELQAMRLWGVRTLPSSVRLYPESDLAAQLVGYVGLDGEGLWGIEADFDHILRGRDGWVTTERDAIGRPIAFTQRTERQAVGGGEVQLTIDRFIQAMVERALQEALDQHSAVSGSIVVMDPHTGAVLAMASRTRSASTDDAGDDDFADRIRNRVISDLYEPGSVFKTLTAAAAIDNGTVTPHSTYEDKGAVSVGGYTIRNWDYSAHGVVTVTELMQRSLNTGTVWLTEEMGAPTFYRYLHDFGVAEPVHIGLSGEAEGMMRTPTDPDWYPVDLATNSYGQGLAVSPLQMLTAVNTFANGGVLMRPYVVSRIVTGDSARIFEPVEVRRPVTAETAEIMRQLMEDTIEEVAWSGARVPGYRVAGKTGTTLVSIPTGYDLDSTIASFAGFIPARDPQVSILVKIDQPSGGLTLGGQVAAPVFAGLAGEIMAYLRVAPTEPVDGVRVAQP